MHGESVLFINLISPISACGHEECYSDGQLNFTSHLMEISYCNEKDNTSADCVIHNTYMLYDSGNLFSLYRLATCEVH